MSFVTPPFQSPERLFRYFMGRRYEKIATYLASLIPQGESLKGLDVGCGDGGVGRRLMDRRPDISLTGVDVFLHAEREIPVQQYDGKTLPFSDRSFDFALLSNMLHHTEDPIAVLRECARVSRRFVLVKDHIADSLSDRGMLAMMDWFGNLGTPVPMPYNFLSSRQWQQLYERAGVKHRSRLSDLVLYDVPLSWIFQSRWQFIDRLEFR